MQIKNYFLLILFVVPLLLAGQEIDTTAIPSLDLKDENWSLPGTQYHLGLFPKTEPEAVRSLSVSGFYRFFATYTQMKGEEDYLLDQGFTAPKRSLFIGDDSQLPNLMLNISARTSKRTSFGFDVFAFQFLDGEVGDSYGAQINDTLRPLIYDPLQNNNFGGSLGINLGVNLTGAYNTEFGSFSARMGGTHWYYMSDFTFGSFQGYNRFTLFERNPWDPIEVKVSDRYNRFYQEGATEQDLRWGNQAFHGLILEGEQLPHNFSASFLLGKTQQDGGVEKNQNFSIGGRIKWEDNSGGFISYNTFNSTNILDTIGTESAGFNVHTIAIKKSKNGFDLDAEFGMGQYYAPTWTEGWGEMISAKLSSTKQKTGIPIELHYFRLSPNVINNSALFQNTSVTESSITDIPAGAAGSTAVLQPFASSMIGIGQMTNNRTGINLNTTINWGKLQLDLGYGISQELEAVNNLITYSHPVNQLSRSRLWRWNFPADVGPYGRQSVVYRDVYETVNLNTDLAVVQKKSFASIEAQGKFKTRIANRNLFLFYLGRYSTAHPDFSYIPVFTEEAYIRQYVSELEVYYELSNQVMWTNYFGYERVIANYETDIDELTRRPRNQTGYGIGTGLDISLGKNAVLVLRHRWFDFEDKSFALDKFNGQETLTELKVFF